VAYLEADRSVVKRMGGARIERRPHHILDDSSLVRYNTLMKSRSTQRTCPRGHHYSKSSRCPVCPYCEAAKAIPSGFEGIAAPARRALIGVGITTLKRLAQYSEADVLALHGFGPSALPPLRRALRAAGLSFQSGRR
jgi:predicted RecB family nuclease